MSFKVEDPSFHPKNTQISINNINNITQLQTVTECALILNNISKSWNYKFSEFLSETHKFSWKAPHNPINSIKKYSDALSSYTITHYCELTAWK